MSGVTFFDSLNDPVSQSLKLLLAAKDVPHEVVEIPESPSDQEVGIQNGKWRADTFLSAIEALEAESNSNEHDKDMKLMKYWVEYVQPLFYRAVVTGNPREGVDLFYEALSYLENNLTSSGPFFGGKTPSLLDYGLYPWLEKIGCWIPMNKRECVGIQTWIRIMTKDPIVSKVMPDCDMTAFKTYKQTLSIKMAGKV